ncbi:MAG TPA: ATP-binding protein [Microthrixaceae bacterium]|nr:ATP-binding protein [Microthrixaceae bacterium]
MPVERSQIQPCDTRFPQAAREFVRAVLHRHRGVREVAPAVDLLVSELVTYAIVRGEFDHAYIEVAVDPDLLRVEVVDPASLFAEVVSDLPLSHTLRSGGIGLLLVDQTCRRWGIERSGDGTALWFELDPAQVAPELEETAL